ncbi:MAG: right-handed parallel beta-helix repeat-containing protein [Planctomycetes bacterium]|nr:right-handed parallel beta-helix repeat-containing protein [Planctomycetota bacterium]
MLAIVPLAAACGRTPRTIHVPRDAATIQAAIDAAGAGDTVLVAPGVYRGKVTLDKPITLASHFATTDEESYIHDTVIDGDGGKNCIHVKGAHPHCTIIGFSICNAENGVRARSPVDLLHNRLHHNRDGVDYESGGGRCAFNVFEDNIDDGIDIDRDYDGVVENNVIRRNGYRNNGRPNPGGDGIEIRLTRHDQAHARCVIRNNVIVGNAADGIQIIDHPRPAASSYCIERNLIADNGAVGIGFMGNKATEEDAVGHCVDEPFVIANNLIRGNGHGMTGGGNALLVNNVFAHNAGCGLRNPGDRAVVERCLFWRNGTDVERVAPGDNLFADPALDADHRPRAGSPVHDAGLSRHDGHEFVAEGFAGVAPDIGLCEATGAADPERAGDAPAAPRFGPASPALRTALRAAPVPGDAETPR